MAEAFRNLLNLPLIHTAATHLRRVAPELDIEGFVSRAAAGLEQLEMKSRAMQIADALEATLPDSFASAAAVLEACLLPVRGDEALAELRSGDTGLAGWIVWPLGEFVARRGLAHPERALACLHALTQRFSAEFAIRPLLIAHPQLCYRTLQQWTIDPSPHVRRLVSEGSRPRLPWGLALPAAIADPSPAYPLLRVLQDDASPYVRRSVANHLNDIGREHPQALVAWLTEHLPGASANRRALLKHASRTLIKRADPGVLQAWGLARAFAGSAALHLQPPQVRIGDAVELRLELRSTAVRSQTLLVDYLVHHCRAQGGSSPKVFKGWRVELPAGSSRVLQRKHSLRPVSTRRYYPGVHRIEIQINGRIVAEAGFVLEG